MKEGVFIHEFCEHEKKKGKKFFCKTTNMDLVNWQNIFLKTYIKKTYFFMIIHRRAFPNVWSSPSISNDAAVGVEPGRSRIRWSGSDDSSLLVLVLVLVSGFCVEAIFFFGMIVVCLCNSFFGRGRKEFMLLEVWGGECRLKIWLICQGS